jgi:hypothetical protein
MKSILSIILFGLLTQSIYAQKLYSGVWRAGTGGTYLWSGVSWANFNDKWSDLAKQNLRLTDIETYTVNGQRLFSGVWEPGSDGYALTPAGLDWAAFNKFWSDNSKTLRLIDIETYVDGGKRYFLGVFRQGGDGYALTPAGLDWKAFNKFWTDYSKTLRLTDVETYAEGGKRYFLGVFRQGSDGYVLSPLGMDWPKFTKYWADRAKENLRLIDIEHYEENGKRLFLGVWRSGTDGYSLIHGVDFGSFSSYYADGNANGLRLIDHETFDSECSFDCLNNVLMPDDPATAWRDGYDYGITATKQHCEGKPGTCPQSPAADDRVLYRWPNLKVGDDYFVRNSVLFDIKDKFLTLPFKTAAADMNSFGGWLYSKGSWHHAIDYSKKGGTTFQIAAAAKGKVIYIGWDTWSGNTMVLSHDVGGKTDAYRTIYMHLRNGADNDCSVSWSKPTSWDLSKPADVTAKNAYETKLKNAGCPETGTRNPTEAYFGKNSEKIDQSLLGKTVNAGDAIAWAGRTGPGGSQGIHLHIFFAHRDPGNNQWYFFDPYGIYAYGSCYPNTVDGAINTPCARYPIVWKNGKPGYPN